jgi:hypothetical protein
MRVQDAIGMGITAVEKGDRTGAHDIFKQTAEFHPNTSEVWVWLGGTSPDLEAAESAFEHAYTIDPENEEASLGLRWVRLRRKVSLADIVGATVPVPTALAGEQATHLYASHSAEAAPTTVQCPNCATANKLDEKFCVQCGQDLSQVTAGAAQPVSSGGLDRRTIIIAVVMVALVLAAIAAFFFLIPH